MGKLWILGEYQVWLKSSAMIPYGDINFAVGKLKSVGLICLIINGI